MGIIQKPDGADVLRPSARTGQENGEHGVSEPRSVLEILAAGSTHASPRARPQAPRPPRALHNFTEYFWHQNPRQMKSFIEGVERHIIVQALQAVFGNQREAAKILGMKSTTLYAKIKKYRIVLERRYRHPHGWDCRIR